MASDTEGDDIPPEEQEVEEDDEKEDVGGEKKKEDKQEEEENNDDDEKEDEGEQEKEPEIPSKPLTREVVADSLSTLGRTGNGLSFAYMRIDVKDQEFTDIDLLSTYTYLRFVNLSGNSLASLGPLNQATELCTLDVSRNNLQTIDLNAKQYLQRLNVGQNKITHLDTSAEFPSLIELDVSENKIDSLDILSQKCPKLQILKASQTGLESFPPLSLLHLSTLVLDGNNLVSLSGIGNLEGLESVSLIGNQIASLDGFDERQTKLVKLDLSENKISNVTELAKLNVLSGLETLTLAENPVTDESGYRLEALIAVKSLQILDDESFEDDERLDAQAQRVERANNKADGETESEEKNSDEGGGGDGTDN